ERLGVHVGEREDLAAAPVLDDARDEAALVEGDVGGVEHGWILVCGVCSPGWGPPPSSSPWAGGPAGSGCRRRTCSRRWSPAWPSRPRRPGAAAPDHGPRRAAGRPLAGAAPARRPRGSFWRVQPSIDVFGLSLKTFGIFFALN